MSRATSGNDSQTAIQLTAQAHAAELAGNFKEAYNLQVKASSLLVKVVANGQRKSEERRRAKLQLRAANDRRTALRACVEGTGTPPRPLPSLATLEKESENPDGVVLLTMVEMGKWTALPAQGTPESPQFLTPLLSPSLPDVTYHIYVERFRRIPSLTWIYMQVKDEAKSQTLYTVAAVKHRHRQIEWSCMSRAAEYHATCADIAVGRVGREITGSDAARRLLGRPLTITTGTGTSIRDAPDRVEKKWTPARFTYGGRRFVWKEGKGLINIVESLYEVKKEWPEPGSKTGKRLDETFERQLLWGEGKIAVSKICTVHMVGGLDQMFREFLLASMITRIIIEYFGHD